jgi:hypothetical protein
MLKKKSNSIEFKKNINQNKLENIKNLPLFLFLRKNKIYLVKYKSNNNAYIWIFGSLLNTKVNIKTLKTRNIKFYKTQI